MARWGADDHEGFDRPRKRSRPRTKERPDYSGAPTARVVTVDRGRYRCLLEDRIVSAVRGRLIARKGIIVGDEVRLDGDTSADEGTLARVVEVLERTTMLRRSADDADTFERPIVANADHHVEDIEAGTALRIQPQSPGLRSRPAISQTVRAALDPLWTKDANVEAVLKDVCAKLTPKLGQ